MISRLKPLFTAGSSGGGHQCILCCRVTCRPLSSVSKPQANQLPEEARDTASPRLQPQQQLQQPHGVSLPLQAPPPPPQPAKFSLSDAGQALASTSSGSSLGSSQLERLQRASWLQVDRDLAHPGAYLALSKSRLTLLVVSTAAAGYAMAPGPVQPLTLAACLVGTALTSASANAVNQLMEVPYDSQMVRTRARPLVIGRISPAAAAAFAAASGAAGVGLLAGLGSLTSAVLAAANLLLYCGAYTPAKRRTVWNTAIGALVGAVPPLIGWTAATGGSLELGGLLLGLLMFHWQFPHFHALSWALRDDYSRAGYCMASVLEPARCRRSALLNSVAFTAVCCAMSVSGLTAWSFVVDSALPNAAFLGLSGVFYWYGDSKSGRRLFQFSLINLPIIFVLMLISRTPDGERDQVRQDNSDRLHFAFSHHGG